jgi:hypothetical protein
VNTASFIASTLDIFNRQFIQGGAVTLEGNSTAGVVVLGSVKANDGDVLLVAAQVDNQGKLIAPNGEAILAAGRTTTARTSSPAWPSPARPPRRRVSATTRSTFRAPRRRTIRSATPTAR